MDRIKYILHCIAGMDYRSLLSTVKTVHEISGKSRVWLFLDVVSCGFKYGAGYKDYLLCEFYNLNAAQRKTYVTRGINNTITKRLNDPAYYHCFDNKNEFYTLFSAYLGRTWLDFSKADKAQFAAFIADKDVIIVKPFDACCGAGVEKLRKSDFSSTDDMYNHLKSIGADIAEEVVQQHSEMNRLNDGSVNTIRVLTVLSEGQAHVVYACVRIGNSDRPVDNINAGGMYAPIDLETGKITCPACDKERKVYETHPKSGCKIEGFAIPHWQACMKMCAQAAHVVPQMGYIGWDVAICEDGPLFIEANNLPGHDALPQMPLQAPDKIGMLPVFKRYIKGL